MGAWRLAFLMLFTSMLVLARSEDAVASPAEQVRACPSPSRHRGPSAVGAPGPCRTVHTWTLQRPAPSSCLLRRPPACIRTEPFKPWLSQLLGEAAGAGVPPPGSVEPAADDSGLATGGAEWLPRLIVTVANGTGTAHRAHIKALVSALLVVWLLLPGLGWASQQGGAWCCGRRCCRPRPCQIVRLARAPHPFCRRGNLTQAPELNWMRWVGKRQQLWEARSVEAALQRAGALRMLSQRMASSERLHASPAARLSEPWGGVMRWMRGDGGVSLCFGRASNQPRGVPCRRAVVAHPAGGAGSCGSQCCLPG